MWPEQHAVIPRDAHNRGAPCGRGEHGSCSISGAVLLTAMKLMLGGSMMRLGPAEEACSECSLACECTCHYSKQGTPVIVAGALSPRADTDGRRGRRTHAHSYITATCTSYHRPAQLGFRFHVHITKNMCMTIIEHTCIPRLGTRGTKRNLVTRS